MIRFSSVLLVLAVAMHPDCTLAAKLPKNWPRCYIDTPEGPACVKKAVQVAIESLAHGVPELHFSSFEPLLIPEMTIGEGKGPVNVVQHFKNIKLHGLTASKVLESNVFIDENKLTAKSITPELRLEADYEMNGRILLLPFSGKGKCNVTLINTHINHTLIGERIVKRGKEFLNIKKYAVTLRPELVNFNFENLFDGQKDLGREMNKVLNDNWAEVFEDVRDGYEKSYGIIFQDISNRVFNRVGIEDIFLFKNNKS